jgi:hypothetical protein
MHQLTFNLQEQPVLAYVGQLWLRCPCTAPVSAASMRAQLEHLWLDSQQVAHKLALRNKQKKTKKKGGAENY